MKYSIVYLIAWHILLISCKPTKLDIRAAAIDKNNRAVNILNQGFTTQNISEALALYDEAITLDSTYYLAYTHKSLLLCQLERYDEAIRTLDHAIRTKPQYVEGLVNQAMLYEKLGDSVMAAGRLKESLYQLEKRIEVSNVDLFKDEVFRAFIFLLQNPEAGREELKKVLRQHPNHPDSTFYTDLFIHFKKSDYLSHFCDSPLSF
jgi:tetratricopeptide (TPR) repeat protein